MFSKNSSLASLRSLWPFIKPYKNWLYLSLGMAIPLSLLNVGPLPIVKYLVDEILVKKDPSKLLMVPIAVIALFFVKGFIRYIHYYSIRIVVVNVNQKVREKLYRHLVHLSTDYFSEKKAGVLLSRITADPMNLDSGIAAINVAIREPITFLGLLGYTLYTNWKLTLLTFTIVPGLAIVFGRTGKYIKGKIADYQEQNGESFSTIQEAISGIRVVHLFNLHEISIKKFTDQMTDITRVLLKISRIEEISSPTVEFITSFATALILYFGARSVLHNEMSSGDLIAFYTAFAMMINPIRQVADINSKLHSASAAMDRINDFFAWEPRVQEISSPIPASTVKSSIQFKDVEFYYPDTPERLVLRGVNFELPVGKTVALVGQSGSGKSSIVQLLTRLYDVTNGSILVDGVDLRSLMLKDWRSQLAVVSQDVFLFHDTIFKNIQMGRPEASHEEVLEAARRAFALEFIQRMPNGFETIVGDRGLKLSGGERQRISIARAFLKNASCLILDEATSNLDNQSEKLVQKTLEELMENRTTLVIAHRLSTIQNADHIIVMREGSIIESGRYAELMNRDGEFNRLATLAGMSAL
jgi:subfamily B ATP-binding cassette protein MsbA